MTIVDLRFSEVNYVPFRWIMVDILFHKLDWHQESRGVAGVIEAISFRMFHDQNINHHANRGKGSAGSGCDRVSQGWQLHVPYHVVRRQLVLVCSRFHLHEVHRVIPD